MRPGLLGTKIGMTRIVEDDGRMTPVTVVKAGPCTVLQVKTSENDGYNALQIGYQDVKPHRSTKPSIGHSAKAGTGPKRHVRELRLAGEPEHEAGDVLTVDAFADAEVKFVDVVGTTKGMGFTGVMRRWGFGGQQASHGVERKHRSAGSIGGHTNTGTGRGIKKGKKMAGHKGVDRRTQLSMRLVKVDADNGLLLIKGSVPGANGSLVLVRQAKKKS